ncbi:SDR family NAD(P)-dependent oxidoreductase [Rhodococcoides yunnanense]|uniref:SDR family NAD(P)-dependent oxidoreductase n=1 Tax=Rhodococcoides yunnanense TaxID=278209 RepID=UPI0009342CDC|nr:SDR family NAD(P)-dependent oxidoreductase [Rhodococcus yunnanensis]
MSFEGKAVIVTGGGSGMGKASALSFAERGANVLVADISGDSAEKTVEEITAAGGKAYAHTFDLRDRDQVVGMIAAGVEQLGGLDVLANVGAISANQSVEEMTLEFWENMQTTNLRGNMLGMQAAIPHLRERNGSIVNVASGAAFYAVPGLAAYSASKAGLIAMGRVLAQENAPYIRVNAVLPGPTKSAMSDGVKSTAAVAAKRAAVGQTIGRWLDPSEIADVVVWVSSDAARAVNGALFRVDGGHHML